MDKGFGYKKDPLFTGKQIGYTKNNKYAIERVRIYTEKVSLADDRPDNMVRELVNLGTYFPRVTNTNFFVDIDDYASFARKYPPRRGSLQRLKKDLFDMRREEKDAVFPIHVYALSYPHPLTQERFVQPIDNFRISKDNKDIYKIHFNIDDIFSIPNKEHIREDNLKVLRLMQNGDENHNIMCRITGINLEQFAIPWSATDVSCGMVFDMHHILVENNISIRCKNKYRSKSFSWARLDDPSNKINLIDLMGTVSLSKSTHAIVHDIPTQGLERYRHSYKPWILQNNRNFDEFCVEFDLELNYDEFTYYHSVASLGTDFHLPFA
jgi:hypothetical protein